VVPGTRYARLAADRYEIDGASIDDLRRVLEDAVSASGVPCRGVVHLWGMVGSEEERKALVSLAENVPGVTRVSDEMIPSY